MWCLRYHTVSPRLLLARLVTLPDTSALVASVNGVPRGWGGDRHALVSIIDAMQQNTWMTAAVATERKPRKPKPITRPKPARKRRVVSVVDLVRATAEAEED